MKVFHHNDMDGYAAAHCVKVYKNLTNDDVKRDFFEVDYLDKSKYDREKFNKVSDFEEVWIVDYSFTEETHDILKSLLEKKCKIRWIDHHTSSIELLKVHPEYSIIPGLINKTVSGAALTYMYLFTNEHKFSECPQYIQLISDYDNWNLKMVPQSEYFKLNYDKEINKWKFLDELYKNRFSSDFIRNCCDIGKNIKQYIDSDNKYFREKYGYESEFEGMIVFVVPKKSNSWIFGDLVEKYPITVCYSFNGEIYEYSIFSNEKFNIDVSKIAEKLGGGGHYGVAGFTSKELLFTKKK